MRAAACTCTRPGRNPTTLESAALSGPDKDKGAARGDGLGMPMSPLIDVWPEDSLCDTVECSLPAQYVLRRGRTCPHLACERHLRYALAMAERYGLAVVVQPAPQAPQDVLWGP